MAKTKAKIIDITVNLVPSDCGRKWTIVNIHTDQGITGYGEATYSHKETVVAEMINDLKEFIIGKDIWNTEEIYNILYTGARTGYRTGGIIFTSAISGIDQALWDIKGKILDTPVCALLGGPRNAEVPIYSHFSCSDINSMIKSAKSTISHGFNALKSGITMHENLGPNVSKKQLDEIEEKSPEDYVELEKTTSMAIEQFIDGEVKWRKDEIILMDDPHGIFDPSSAIKVAKTIEPYNLLFLEEPVGPEDIKAYSHIRKSTTVPIAGSERLTSKKQFNRFFENECVDIAQPDIVYIGGISEMKKVCSMAEAYQVKIAPHNTKGPVGIMAAAHVMASSPNALIQEFMSPEVVPWRNDILENPLEIKNSCLVIDDRPGLGIEFNDKELNNRILK